MMTEYLIHQKVQKTTPDLPTPEGAVDQQWRFLQSRSFFIFLFTYITRGKQ